jgi:predicted  nucleic acid-binding Zn-ribbon protein
MKADNSVLEEAILVLMDEVEAETKQANAGKDSLKFEEKKLNDRKAELAEKEKVSRTGVEELKAKRKDFISQVSLETASFYERILAKKSGVALARIDSENCSSCQMKLRPQVLNEVKLQEKIILCENCTRILYEEA